MLNIATSSSLLLAFGNLGSCGVLHISCIWSLLNIVVSYVVIIALFVCWDVFDTPCAGISSSVVVGSRPILLVLPFDLIRN